MQNRIKLSDLQEQVDTINTLMGNPMTYSHWEGDEHIWHSGHWFLSQAYGGVNVHQLMESSAIRTPLYGGYYTKRELYEQLRNFIAGLQTRINLDYGGLA